MANRRGRIARAVRVFTHVTAPIPGHGWYLNIHQGNSGNIRQQRPADHLLPAAAVRGHPQWRSLDHLDPEPRRLRHRGPRHGAAGNVDPDRPGAARQQRPGAPVLSAAAERRDGSAGLQRSPPFPGVTTATFCGPVTHDCTTRRASGAAGPAVGSYQSSSAPAGVLNQGMIYLRPGQRAAAGPGPRSTCPPAVLTRPGTCGPARGRGRQCLVMDTIAHSTMGNLVVGNYDLSPIVRGGLASGNAFIYNMTRPSGRCCGWPQRPARPAVWHLAERRGWQPALHAGRRLVRARPVGPGPPARIPAELHRADRRLRAAAYYRTTTARAAGTHFEGITAVPGGFNLVAHELGPAVSLAVVPVKAPGPPARPDGTRYRWPRASCARRLQPRDREHRLPQPRDGRRRPAPGPRGSIPTWPPSRAATAPVPDRTPTARQAARPAPGGHEDLEPGRVGRYPRDRHGEPARSGRASAGRTARQQEIRPPADPRDDAPGAPAPRPAGC